MNHNLFTYGSLMFPEVWRYFQSEESSDHQNATLTDFKRISIKNEYFPAIVPAGNFAVTGILYHNISDETLDKINLFEGDLYLKNKVTVETQSNLKIEAWTYILSPQYYHLADKPLWDESKFKTLHLQEFISECFPDH